MLWCSTEPRAIFHLIKSDIPGNVTTNKHYIQSILTQTIIGKFVNYFPDMPPESKVAF